MGIKMKKKNNLTFSKSGIKNHNCFLKSFHIFQNMSHGSREKKSLTKKCLIRFYFVRI